MLRLFTTGRIHTMDSRRPTGARLPDALLVEDERIVALGATDELLAAAPSGTERVHLGGRAVLPGLGDSHIHTEVWARGLRQPNLRRCRSLEEALDTLRPFVAQARRAPGTAWVFGGQWNVNAWDVPVVPDRRSLDAIAPDVPVALGSVDWHTLWLNTRALVLLGLTRDVRDPDGGTHERDERGDLTGILREAAAVPVRDGLMASALGGDVEEDLAVGQRELLRRGVTSIHDIDGTRCSTGFTRLRERGELSVRVLKVMRQEYVQDVIDRGDRTGTGDDWLRLGPLKLFADGAIGSHTCHMSEHFPGEPGNHGTRVSTIEELTHLVGSAARAGIASAVHAIGDRAVTEVLDAFEATAALSRPWGLRQRIEHAQYVHRADIPRMAALGVTASMQPLHCTADILLNDFVVDRPLVAYGWRSLRRAGIDVVLGSDAPVEDPNPFHGIHAAVTRQRADGTPVGGWQPHETLSRAEAISLYTRAIARVSGEQEAKGHLAPGMLADFVVLDRDPLTEDAAAVRDTVVEATVVGGRVCHRRED